mmetsp:Transcript_40190/g.86987  ORF Transcript_40190/g.86987 Transcript_40190/m.86987 type:complete len:98 (+) Transcript_40190:82-375(+)
MQACVHTCVDCKTIIMSEGTTSAMHPTRLSLPKLGATTTGHLWLHMLCRGSRKEGGGNGGVDGDGMHLRAECVNGRIMKPCTEYTVKPAPPVVGLGT